MPKSRSQRAGQKRVAAWQLAAGVAILAIAIFGGFALTHRKPKPDFSSLENGLQAMGYSLFEPVRDDLMPGSIIRLNPIGQELILAGSNLELGKAAQGHSADQRWRVTLASNASGKARIPGFIGSLSGLDASEAEVTLKDLTIVSFPLKTLADALHSHPGALSANALTNPAVVIVSEVLVAGKLVCDFRSHANEHIDLRQKIKGELNIESGFKVSAEGKLVSERSVPIGFKSHGLTSQALDLAPVDFVAKVIPSELSPSQVEQARRTGNQRLVTSEFQLFAFCIGLGNYQPASLDGAAPSAERVADRLRTFISFGAASQIEVFTTRPPTGGDAGSARPAVSRAEILDRVDSFVKRAQPQMDPKRHSVVICYYCGHGLAQGISRSAYIVPEDVPVGPNSAVDKLAEKLVDVGELDTHLAPLAEQRVFLIDGCRRHQNEDQQLLQAAPSVGLNRADLGNIIKVLQFISGKDGPQPMLFGGPDGENAIPVQAAWSSVRVGPLAEVLDRLLTGIQDNHLVLPLADFISRMQLPVLVRDTRIQAYTSIRDEYLQQFPKVAIFRYGPSQIAMRETPYDPNKATQPATSQAMETASRAYSGPCDVKVRRVGNVRLPNIEDFTFSIKESRIYAADSDGSIWTWTQEDSKAKPVKGDVAFPSLGSDQDAAYLYGGSVRELYRLAPDGPTKISEGYVEFLGRGASGKTVLLVENDHTVGTPDCVRRLPRTPPSDDLTNCPSILQFDTTDVQGLTETSSGKIFYSSTAFSGCLATRTADGKEMILCHGLGRPGPVAESAGFVFCLDLGGMLYRISPDQKAQFLSLADVGFGDSETARHITEHGLQALRPDALWVSAGDGVFELDLGHARWQAFDPK